jgi:hypothetical protein
MLHSVKHIRPTRQAAEGAPQAMRVEPHVADGDALHRVHWRTALRARNPHVLNGKHGALVALRYLVAALERKLF